MSRQTFVPFAVSLKHFICNFSHRNHLASIEMVSALHLKSIYLSLVVYSNSSQVFVNHIWIRENNVYQNLLNNFKDYAKYKVL